MRNLKMPVVVLVASVVALTASVGRLCGNPE
ncbi:MAG: hypothetical protein ACI84R_002792 [Candidatus Azotimanducaceae bacterium]|jgi:hypothetical protein